MRPSPFAVLVTTVSGAELVAADLGQQRLGAWLFAGFGTIALCLALGSVFKLVRHAVTLRRREFAILAALGASPAAIVRKAVVMGVGPVAAGGIAGAAAAAIIAPLAESALFGVTASDPVTYSSVIVLVIVAATMAAVAGARRPRRLPIAEVLRAK